MWDGDCAVQAQPIPAKSQPRQCGQGGPSAELAAVQAGTPPAICWLMGSCAGLKNWGGWRGGPCFNPRPGSTAPQL